MMAEGLATAARRLTSARMWLIGLLLICAAIAATASPVIYLLDGDGSRVGFVTAFGQDEVKGRFPVTEARLALDFSDVSNTRVSVRLDASAAQANFPFAAQALKGPDMLDTRRFPTIGFESTSVARQGMGALVRGDLTIRGVTRPVELQAVLLRRKDADPDDLGHLFIRLTGAIDRHEFGVSGWPDAVSKEVRLDILAEISRMEAE